MEMNGTYHDASIKGHLHGVPQVPFTIDGSIGKPAHLSSLRDRPLHSVVTQTDDRDKQLTVDIFTDLNDATAALVHHARGRGASTEISELPQPWTKLGLEYDLSIWKLANYMGCGWGFDTNTDMTVLTNFDNAWACGFLWWGWQQLGTGAESFIIRINWPMFGFRDRSGNTVGWALDPPHDIITEWSGGKENLAILGWGNRAHGIHIPGTMYP